MHVFRHEMLGLCWLGNLTQNEARMVIKDYVPHYQLIMGSRTNEYAVDASIPMIVAKELERIRRSSKEK